MVWRAPVSAEGEERSEVVGECLLHHGQKFKGGVLGGRTATSSTATLTTRRIEISLHVHEILKCNVHVYN